MRLSMLHLGLANSRYAGGAGGVPKWQRGAKETSLSRPAYPAVSCYDGQLDVGAPLNTSRAIPPTLAYGEIDRRRFCELLDGRNIFLLGDWLQVDASAERRCLRCNPDGISERRVPTWMCQQRLLIWGRTCTRGTTTSRRATEIACITALPPVPWTIGYGCSTTLWDCRRQRKQCSLTCDARLPSWIEITGR